MYPTPRTNHSIHKADSRLLAYSSQFSNHQNTEKRVPSAPCAALVSSSGTPTGSSSTTSLPNKNHVILRKKWDLLRKCLISTCANSSQERLTNLLRNGLKIRIRSSSCEVERTDPELLRACSLNTIVRESKEPRGTGSMESSW